MKTRLFVILLIVALAISALAASNASGFGPTGWEKAAKNLRSGSQPMLESALREGITPSARPASFIKDALPKMSGDVGDYFVKKYNLSQLAGKKFVQKTAGQDQIVAAEAGNNENEPSVAVNPANESIVVAFTHYYGIANGSCQVMVSYDGGQTFNYNDYYFPPLPSGSGSCSDPVVRFSPDGKYVYYFYMDVWDPGSGEVADVIMQRAYGNAPKTAAGGPVTIFSSWDAGTSTYIHFNDKEWGDVHTYDMATNNSGSASVLYATATKFYGDGSNDCGIEFNVSYDYGVTWYYANTNPFLLAYEPGCVNVVQGSRPIGGNYDSNSGAHFMAACWYWSGFDGFLLGGFYTECIANDGLGTGSWSPYFYPVVNRKYELPYWLGPNSDYYRWNGGMFPSLAVDEYGALYVTNTYDPTVSKTDVESGNVLLNRFYLNYGVTASWPAPIVVGSGTTAQGYPTVAAHFDPITKKSIVIVAYADHTAANAGYYTVYRKGYRAWNSYSMTFGGKVKVSDRWSISDDSFIGDYIDSGMTSRRYHVVWTDRADAYGQLDYDDDVLHDYFTP